MIFDDLCFEKLKNLDFKKIYSWFIIFCLLSKEIDVDVGGHWI